MKHYLSLILLLLCPLLAHADVKDIFPKDYVWNSWSKNSSESMPCGGGDIGMNVWVENGDVLFYLSRSGMFDENNTLLKAGRVRLSIEGNPLKSGFKQTLCLKNGGVRIEGGDVCVELFADVFSPNVFLEVNSKKAHKVRVSYESWRTEDRVVTKAECQQTSYKWNLPDSCLTFKDDIVASERSLYFSHTNKAETVFDFTVSKEGLDSIKSRLYNPLKDLSFGGRMSTDCLQYVGTSKGRYASTDFVAFSYEGLTKSALVNICLSVEKGDALRDVKTAKKRSQQWWQAFWQRSYIHSQDERVAGQLRNYELFRYMLGCNAKGKWPTKFNGGLFTFDPVYVDERFPFTPDFRFWGGGTMTAQNQRLVYWGMLKSGDGDMMTAQMDTYLRMLPSAEARTEFYWHHKGASFTEQIENCGLPNPAEYGKHKAGDDMGTERNAWLEYLWDTSLEFCYMIVQMRDYFSMDISKYAPLIDACIDFFPEHYTTLAKQRGMKPLTEEGKLVLYPSSGAETYKMAYNPSSTIAALRRMAMCWRRDSVFEKMLPEIPLRTIQGDTCIAPAVAWMRIQNEETPQLYPVFPWRIYGMGRPGLEIARNTWYKDPQSIAMRSPKGWKQDNIWAACLGLKDEAMDLMRQKFGSGPFRFPAFWPNGFDWTPDHNRGGAAMIGLEEMLLQEKEDGELITFPAWQEDVDVSFRLHATKGRIVEGEMKGGKPTVAVKTKLVK